MKVLALTAVILFSNSLAAASLGTYRIYLDGDNTSQKFPVINRSVFPEECEVNFKYRGYKGEGQESVIEYGEEEASILSQPALERVRFSPQKFTLLPGTTQNIAFSYRRKVGDTASELRTYAAVRCMKATSKTSDKQSMRTALELMVPLVIRTGNLSELDVNLKNTVIESGLNKVARLEIDGKRSVYGDIQIIDTNNNVVEVLEKNAVIYPEMKYRDVTLPTGLLNTENIYIQFK
jgi:hypothetical protein